MEWLILTWFIQIEYLISVYSIGNDILSTNYTDITSNLITIFVVILACLLNKLMICQQQTIFDFDAVAVVAVVAVAQQCFFHHVRIHMANRLFRGSSL